MDFTAALDHLRAHSAALRAAAVDLGPEAPVPTCPGWTMKDLVAHLARVQAWPRACIEAGPDADRVRAPRPPEAWDELLAWWDTDDLIAALTEAGPDGAAWTFLAHAEHTAGWWARRQAHEVAVHRLDAEHARGHEVPTLLFDDEFAADGVDEFLALISRRPASAEGRILLHAADAGRAWPLRLVAGKPLEVGGPQDAAAEPDVSVVGTADAVYRAVWGRPSHAVVTGDAELLAQIKAP